MSLDEFSLVSSEILTVRNLESTFARSCLHEDFFYKRNNYLISRWSKVTETINETTYKVTKLITNKEYTFRVTAVNEAGPGEASPNTPYLKISKLLASEPPTILEALQNVVIGLGETVTLSCVIGGIPAPRITWYSSFQFFFPITTA